MARIDLNRARDLEKLRTEQFEVVVVGGGITGAGVFRLASQHGFKTLLLEQKDFSWGTSSRSSKMVHGGLRYILQYQFRNSVHSVHERERMLRDYPGLIESQELLFPTGSSKVAKWTVGFALSIYDWIAGRRAKKWYESEDAQKVTPGFKATMKSGAWGYSDARGDDARLVQRIIDEGLLAGGTALNYMQVQGLLRSDNGQVTGVAVEDKAESGTYEIAARVVINATGAWADNLRHDFGHEPRIRPLRGSHIVISKESLPVYRALGYSNPKTGMRGFINPWEGAILVGITDLDHDQDMNEEAIMSEDEVEHLLGSLNFWFPDANIRPEDVISTMSGVRPVVGTGKDDPSKESREEVIWADDGMVTVTGGKLTTFALMALKTMNAASPWLDGMKFGREKHPPLPPAEAADDPVLMRLWGRYGSNAPELIKQYGENLSETMGTTEYLWAELRWSAETEGIVHLDDLLLRRLRFGLVLPRGGAELMPRIRQEIQPILGWDDSKWEQEEKRYFDLWEKYYGTAAVFKSVEKSATAE